jgi:hypothetical protein
MNIKKESPSTYSPVPWEYREVIDEAIKKNFYRENLLLLL